MTVTILTEQQIERYAHHLILKDIRGEGQRKLLASKVLVLGAGGLGSPAGFIQNCRSAGVVGTVAGIIGSVQAAEAIKYLVGIGEMLTDRMFTVDLCTLEFRTIRLKRNPLCPACAGR